MAKDLAGFNERFEYFDDEDGLVKLENMQRGDPRVLALLALPPADRADGPFRFVPYPDNHPHREPNQHGIVGVEEELRRVFERTDNGVAEKWESTKWKIVECVCGALLTTNAPYDSIKKCPCASVPKQKFKLAGKRFSRLLVKGYNNDTGLWECVCDCGGSVDVTTARLRNNTVRSCGECSYGTGKRLKGKAEVLPGTPTGYKILNVAARHAEFAAYVKAATGMTMMDVTGTALEIAYPEMWQEWLQKKAEAGDTTE